MIVLSIELVHGTIDGKCYHYDRLCARKSAPDLITIPHQLYWAHARGLKPCAICTPRNHDDWDKSVLVDDHHPLIEEAQVTNTTVDQI